MSEPATTTPVPALAPSSADPGAERRCPWCSAALPVGSTEQCPTCHANLVAVSADRLPGLTEVEAATTTRARRADAPKRSKLLAWISGDVDDDGLPPSDLAAEAFAPPSKDVRREIWRLTLEAEGLEVAPDGAIIVPGAQRPESAPVEAAGTSPVSEDAMAATSPVASATTAAAPASPESAASPSPAPADRPESPQA